MATINKKNFIKLVMESIHDVDEMAIRQKKVQAPRRNPETGNLIIPQFVPLWKENNPTRPGEDGVPDAWIINVNKVPGGEKLVVPMGLCEDITEFIEDNEEWLESIGALYGLEPELHYCVGPDNETGMWKFQPRNKRFMTQFIHRGVYESASQTIKRYMHNVIRHYFGKPDVKNLLDMYGIPTIRPNDPKHLDRYGVVNNDEVNYQTHSFIAFNSIEQFNKFIEDSLSGKYSDEEYKSYHLARQFNQIYNNWKETKKQSPEYFGQTKKYFLAKFGLDPDNTSMVVRTDLKINGRLMDDKYTWTLQFVVKYGSKLENERRIKGDLKLSKDIVITKTASVASKEPFTDKTDIDNYTIVHDMNISSSFEDAVKDLIVQIKGELKPVGIQTTVNR
jgi:hypothetical protein